MKPIRQGDVILLPVKPTEGNKLDGLREDLDNFVLAEGEVTGHKHRISEGQARLYTENSDLYLRVFSGNALLFHEEHGSIDVPQGGWLVRIQREYEPEGWRYVTD
ncbi:hypothetical protein Riv7116_6867 [Rivularia sp. PCC 7116]|uniref:hypothetical protein n=1 Tax=Rivularia sp. PCC 7116 TaxID=373994 RepID=UPI00029F1752|nr:hypothetical protein [Rivularia sp. PCC 7116]AFY59181.1 hypothetical protein Riv7116_6867 [Rivularia sp. PCC 7116]